MYERWYDGSLGGDFFRVRAQCMDVNARNYKWSESRSKVCRCVTWGRTRRWSMSCWSTCEKYERQV
ncbi:hypothetical protein E2C01_090238 [Portunus trituberculatus]|uniref:Uncharacterized protein n=1 Tax=Portunus trituberculatus TaxID=210409 RepID=A0A5B7JRN8_PORTR|nr:hypothetical protein [Portunus trituberculatus]